MKKFNITVLYTSVGTVTIDVPEEYTLAQAIQWAKENTDQISLPYNAEYVDGSLIIDEENCDFEN